MLTTNIQTFADPADPVSDETTTTTATTTTTDNKTTNGVSYSEDYVQSLRNEAANYRTKAKKSEAALRSIFGLQDNEDLGNVQDRITALRQQQAHWETANKRLIAAEIKTLEGYDHKLLAKVIELDNVKIDDQGNVTGITEAAQAAAKEYPAVLVKQRQQYAPTNPASSDAPTMTKEAFKKLSYTEKLNYKTKYPEEYKKLIGGR